MDDMSDAIDRYDAAPFILDGESFEIVTRVPAKTMEQIYYTSIKF